MASRQDEKEARRRERLEQERKQAAASTRSRRLQLVGGGILALAAIAAVVIAIAALTGDDEKPRASAPTAGTSIKLPAPATSNIEQAARAAGCTLSHPKFEGAGHQQKDFQPADYRTNPPTSGAHVPDWYDDGTYAPGTTPKLGMLVHTLEHGRINVQYKPGTPAGEVAKLEALLAEQNDGYHMLLYQNTTGMTPRVAATAWTQSLTCPAMNDRVFDAIRTFRSRYIDKGPEKIP